MIQRILIICTLGFVLSLAPLATFSQAAGQDGFIGVITKSDKQEKVGARITFANMRMSRPFITYPDGIGAEAIKVFEDDTLIVLVFVAELTGSTDTFHLNKKRMRFTRVEIGALEATVEDKDFQPIISFGTLKTLK
jgi:hypothetical protein